MYSPNATSIGKTAAEIGVSGNAFSGNFYGFQRVNGETYFQYFQYGDNYYIATAIPRSTMYRARLPISLITVAISLVLILILSCVVTLTTPDEEKLFSEVSNYVKNLKDANVFTIQHGNRQRTTVKASARWGLVNIKWREKAPEQKLVSLVGIIISIFILYILIGIAYTRGSANDSSVIAYILSGMWDRGLNIFALSACVLLITFTVLFITLMRIPVHLITSVLGTRSETIGHLLLSVFKYGGTIASIFYAFYLLGLDASSLLASAGILSLVVGLGAQSLIKDVIAGIFIVFEGEFRVGDIVTISDFRGTVIDIGLRTTKIQNYAGNIKIFNNSEVSGVLNMTQQNSVAMAEIAIEYGQDLEYVESVLARELPLLPERYPAMVDTPSLGGVAELGESGITLRVAVHCAEKDVAGVTRALNRELLLIFYHNNIGIPFPHVTVAQYAKPSHDITAQTDGERNTDK